MRWLATVVNSGLFAAIVFVWIELRLAPTDLGTALDRTWFHSLAALFMGFSFAKSFVLSNRILVNEPILKPSHDPALPLTSTGLAPDVGTILRNLKSNLETVTDYPGPTIHEFRDRLTTLSTLTSDETMFDALVRQYEVAVENERFYERTVWQIAAILVPTSLALAGFALRPPQTMGTLIAGLAIYLFFLFIFSRFRISIRLFRGYALLLEEILGLYSHTFVYRTHFAAFGKPIRIWTLLVFFGGLYLNFVLYMLLI